MPYVSIWNSLRWLPGVALLADGGCSAGDTSRDEAALARAREQMVAQQIQGPGRAVQDDAVLAAMRDVPRHRFVPENLRAEAYADRPLPIGHGQTISQPFIVAYMTQHLALRPGMRVLEIGTGSGYQAAILAHLGAEVWSIEIVPALAAAAVKNLQAAGYDGVRVRSGDGYRGWPEAAPFARIIVTCSPEAIPAPLIAQLGEGGRLIIPVGERNDQSLVVLEKRDGVITRRAVMPVRFVPMTGEAGQVR